jgi:predicted RNase H-like nuclease
MSIITRTQSLLSRLIAACKSPTAQKASETYTLAVNVDATDAIATLEAVSARVASLRSEIETSSILAEIRARFDKLDCGTDMILAAVANMQDRVEGQPTMADVLNQQIARYDDGGAVGGLSA